MGNSHRHTLSWAVVIKDNSHIFTQTHSFKDNSHGHTLSKTTASCSNTDPSSQATFRDTHSPPLSHIATLQPRASGTYTHRRQPHSWTQTSPHRQHSQTPTLINNHSQTRVLPYSLQLYTHSQTIGACSELDTLTHNTQEHTREFPGGPVGGTLRFHYPGHGFNPWSGN